MLMKKPLPTEFEKKEVEKKFRSLIEEWKKTRLDPPHPDFNYKIDIYSKWYRNSFYLCSLYKSDSPNRLADTFEEKISRLEYKGRDKFDIAYMRHTGQWYVMLEEQSLDECLDLIKKEELLQP
jgi:hypothetical protein